MRDDHLANVLGAVALAVTEQAVERVTATSTIPPSSVAALTSLEQFLAGASIDQLRSVLGLTHSGSVRLVDRLSEAGLVDRGPGPDGRTRAITLTPAGSAAAGQAGRIRASYLDGLLDGLSPTERRTLSSLLAKVITNVVKEKDGGAWICRLCDLQACGRAAGRCPTAQAAAAKYRSHPHNTLDC